MKVMKAALLEDNKNLLKQLKEDLEETKLVQPIIYCDNSEDFLTKVRERINEVDFVVLDIELDGENLRGTAIATLLKKPTLFVSGETKKYLSEIEEIELNHNFPVKSILKPVSVDKLNKILPKLFNEIKFLKEPTLEFNFGGIKREKPHSSIVFIESISDNSNNKIIYFIDEKPLTLYNFSFSKMFEKGYDIEMFTNPHQSYRVSKQHIKGFDSSKRILLISCMNAEGKQEEFEVPVSENNLTKIRNLKL